MPKSSLLPLLQPYEHWEIAGAMLCHKHERKRRQIADNIDVGKSLERRGATTNRNTDHVHMYREFATEATNHLQHGPSRCKGRSPSTNEWYQDVAAAIAPHTNRGGHAGM